jgi:hypothetical protein
MTNYCEDYPCCGHTDLDPCSPQEYDKPGYFDNPLNALASYDPGSPEWQDALDEQAEFLSTLDEE